MDFTILEFAVYEELRSKIKDDIVSNNTKGIFEQIKKETEIVDWKSKTSSIRKMGVIIYDVQADNKFLEGKICDVFQKIIRR